MSKYLTPFDKSLAEAFGLDTNPFDPAALREKFKNLIGSSEEEKKKRAEEDGQKIKPEISDSLKEVRVPGMPLRVKDITGLIKTFDSYFDKPQKEKSRQQLEDQKILGSDIINVYTLPDGNLATSSSDTVLREKLKQLNSPLKVKSRFLQIEKEKDLYDAEPDIPFLETFLIGRDAGLDRANISPAERIVRKTSNVLGESARAATAGLVRGAVVLPQLNQLAYKYGVGSIEYLLRKSELYGSGQVDFDELDAANTAAKIYSDQAEKFVKAVDEAMGVKEFGYSNRILMYTTDFAVPLNLPGKAAKVMALTGEVASDVYRITRGLPVYRPDPDDVTDLLRVTPVKPSPVGIGEEKELLNAFKEARRKNPWMTQSLKDFAKYSEKGKEILNRRAQLVNKAMDDLDVTYGKRPILERMRDRIKYGPQGYRKEARVADYPRGEKGEKAGELQPQYFFQRELTLEEKLAKITYDKVMRGQTVVGAGAIAGAWDYAFEGTEYKDLSYVMGLAGAFASPTATMKVVEKFFDTAFGGKYGLQQVGIPFVTIKRPESSETGRMVDVPLNLPSLLYGIGKFVNRQKLKSGEIENYNETDFARRVGAMAMGLPFYKAFLLDNKKAINEADGLTALEAATMFTQKEFKHLEKFAGEVMAYLPKKYLDSYAIAVKQGNELVEKIRNSEYGDKTAEFYLTLEQLAAGVRMNGFTAVLGKLLTDPDLKQASGNVKNVLTIFRTQHQELQDQVGYIQQALKDLMGGLDKSGDDFIELKRGADIIIASMKKNIDELQSTTDSLKQQYGITHKSTHFELEELLNSEVGFNLTTLLGRGLKDLDEISARENSFYGDIDNNFQTVYNEAEKAVDAKWNALDDALQDRNLDVDDFIESLESLKNQNLEQFGEILPLIKNKSAYMAFGNMTKNLTEGKQISYANNIDLFIRLARYNGLKDQDLNELIDIGRAINYNVTFEGGGKLAVKMDAGTGKFDLQGTLDDLDEFASSSGLTKEEYLRHLYAQLDVSNAADNVKFKKLFDPVVSAIDLHNLRKSFSRWSWNNKDRPAGQSIYDQTKVLDNIFDEHNIPELKEANAAYTAFKRVWHESFLGEKLKAHPEIGQQRPGFGIVKAQNKGIRDYLYSFFQGNIENIPKNKKLFDELFKDIKDDAGNVYGVKGIKDEVQKQLETILIDGVNLGRIRLGSSYDEKMRRIAAFKSNDLISDDVAEKLKMYVEFTDPVGNYKVSKELDTQIDDLNKFIKNIDDDQREALRNSTHADLEKINDLDSLFDYFFPQNGSSTYARTGAILEELGSKEAVDKFREVAGTAARRVDERRADLPEGESPVTLQDIDRNLQEISYGNIASETGSRFDVYLRTRLGIVPGQKLDPSDAKDAYTIDKLKKLRNGIVSTMIRRSVNVTSDRKAQLDLSQQQAKFKELNENKKHTISAFQLNSDFNIAEMMNMYDDVEESLRKIDGYIGENPEFTNEFTELLEAMIAVKGDVPSDFSALDLSSIPKGLTYPAALSRLYSGFRGVVSWRYLATEQIVREHQRAKHMMFHKILSDPEFLKKLKLIMDNKPINEKKFVDEFMEIMKTPGSRAVVYDADADDQANYDPTPTAIVDALRDNWLSSTLYLDELAKVMGIDTAMTGFTQKLYPPKNIAQGDLEYFPIEEPQGTLQSIVPIGVRRQVEKETFDIPENAQPSLGLNRLGPEEETFTID